MFSSSERKTHFPVKKVDIHFIYWFNFHDKLECSNPPFALTIWNFQLLNVRWVFNTHWINFSFPVFCCWIVTPLLHQWNSRSAAALPIIGSFSAFSYCCYFFFISVCSVFLLLYFCLSPGWFEWASEWVSRLCCVLFDSSLGAKLSLMQLLGPTVFLKSVSINIIMACSRHHWIFYCNVEQNITPTLNAAQRKSYCLTETSFWLKGLCEVCFICGSFCVFVVFSFLCFRKSARPRLIQWLRVFFFLSGIYYWHFPGIGLGVLHACHIRKTILFSLAG